MSVRYIGLCSLPVFLPVKGVSVSCYPYSFLVREMLRVRWRGKGTQWTGPGWVITFQCPGKHLRGSSLKGGESGSEWRIIENNDDEELCLWPLTFPLRGIGQRLPGPVGSQAKEQIKRGRWVKGPCTHFCSYIVPFQRQDAMGTAEFLRAQILCLEYSGPSALIHLSVHRLILLIIFFPPWVKLVNHSLEGTPLCHWKISGTSRTFSCFLLTVTGTDFTIS